MLARAKKRLRSWMFIYVGLVAAIILSSHPANVDAETRLEGNNLPILPYAPLHRKDI